MVTSSRDGRQIAIETAEFVAGGAVAQLVERARQARRQLGVDVAALDPDGPPRGAVDVEDAGLALGRTQGGALQHIFEELAQHRGQMEVTRDLLLTQWAVSVSGREP